MIKLTRILIIIAIIILSITSTVVASVTIKFGSNFGGSHKVEGSGESSTEDVGFGFSIAGEIYRTFFKHLDLGAGIILRVPQSQYDYSGNFNFLPIYGLIKTKINENRYLPYLFGQVGYNYFYGDDEYTGSGSLDGGLYYGFGIGANLTEVLSLELLYSINNGSIDYMNESYDVEFSSFTIQFGFTF